MELIELRHKLLEYINTADERFLLKVQQFIEQNNSEKSLLSDAQKLELDAQEVEYNEGKGKTYSWSDIKQELIDEHGLQA